MISSRKLRSGDRRRGATIVECAFVVPIAFLVIIGIILWGFGIFRYHQIEHLSENTARWLSLRGPRYQKRTETSEPTVEQVMKNVIQPSATSLDLDKLNCDITWNADKTTVTVELKYAWKPPGYWDTVTFRSVSTTPVIQ